MNLSVRTVVLAAAGICFTASIVQAQSTPPVGASRQYRLRAASSLTEGCFDPCACPLSLAEEFNGRFKLTFVGVDPLFANYRVGELLLNAPRLNRTYTGGGTYRIGGEFALVQSMTLDVLVNGATAQHFESGTVQAVGPVPRWPRIDISLSRNNLFCFDTDMHIVAAPVADWNDSGDISVGDIFGFLESYFAGDGDADGSGITSVEDIFSFLAEYFDPA